MKAFLIELNFLNSCIVEILNLRLSLRGYATRSLIKKSNQLANKMDSSSRSSDQMLGIAVQLVLQLFGFCFAFLQLFQGQFLGIYLKNISTVFSIRRRHANLIVTPSVPLFKRLRVQHLHTTSPTTNDTVTVQYIKQGDGDECNCPTLAVSACLQVAAVRYSAKKKWGKEEAHSKLGYGFAVKFVAPHHYPGREPTKQKCPMQKKLRRCSVTKLEIIAPPCRYGSKCKYDSKKNITEKVRPSVDRNQFN